jgi:hypothetical protein
MATDTQEPTPGTREHFLRVTQLRRWGTIQEDVERCRAGGYFTPAFDATALAQMARIHVRRRLKQVTTAQGGVSANLLYGCEQVILQNLISVPDTWRVVCLTHP